MKFQDYLKVVSSESKGFKHRLGIGNDGVTNAIFWISSAMRSNFEIFGSCIFVDATKRELNALKWPYFSITMKNELNKICAACEALIISEINEACDFMIKSCLEMCPKKKIKRICLLFLVMDFLVKNCFVIGVFLMQF